MASGQFLGQWSTAVTFTLVVMVTQFNRVSALGVTFDRRSADALAGSPFSLTCKLNTTYAEKRKINLSDLDIVLEYSDNKDYITINKKHIRMINATSLQLRYSQLPVEFVNRLRYITCRVKERSPMVSMPIVVKERHVKRPNVTRFLLDNWEVLNIDWEPAEDTDRHFGVNYEIWFRNDSSTSAFTKAENCAGKLCTLVDPFRLTSPGEVLMLKVNGSVKTPFSRGILETVTSEEVRVNLTEYITPRKIDEISVVQNKSTKILVFKPPKTNRNISYDVTVKCTKPAFNQSETITRLTPDSTESTIINESINEATESDRYSKTNLVVAEPLVGLPPHSSCTVYVRAISVTGGKWSEWASHHFQTLQDVPLALPRSCKGCFQVKNAGMDSLLQVIVYFTPLSEEEARGIVELYRIKTIEDGFIKNVTELVPDPHYLSSFLLSDLSNESEYEINIEAKTKNGYNETLNLSSMAILVPQSKYRPSSLSYKFTFIVLNATSVRATLEMKKRRNRDRLFLFWCKGRAESDRPCEDALKWKKIPIASTGNAIRPNADYVIKLEEDEFSGDFVFGSGIERSGKSSGITWSSCTYDIRSPPPKPRIESYSSTSSGISIVLLEPRCEYIGHGGGFVIGYRVFFCPIEFVDSTNGLPCLEEMRSVTFSGQYEVLNLNNLRPEQAYLVLVCSISETRTSANVTLEARTLRIDDSHMLTMIAAVFGVVAVSVFIVLIARHRQVSFLRPFKVVPVVLPPAVVQSKPQLQQLIMDDAGYRNHQFGAVHSSGRGVEFSSPVEFSPHVDSCAVETVTGSLSPSHSSDDPVVQRPVIAILHRSDSRVEVTTPLETILPPLTGFAPIGGFHGQALLPRQQAATDDGSAWGKNSSERCIKKEPSYPIVSAPDPFLTSTDYGLSASGVTSSECSGGTAVSRPPCFNEGSGYAFCQQDDVSVILPVPSGEAQPVALNSSTYHSNSSGMEQGSSSCSVISSDGVAISQLNSFNCNKFQSLPLRSEELIRNEAVQEEEEQESYPTGNDGDQLQVLLPFSDYSSVILDTLLK